MPDTTQKFVVGARIKIFRDAEAEAVDEGIVKTIESEPSGSPATWK